MKIAIMLYDRFTALDCIGPYDVLCRMPGAEVVFCARERGEVRTDSRMLGITADVAMDEIPSPDILLIPGGFGTRPLMTDEYTIEWIQGVHSTSQWTTSVCTGSLLLGAAGLLNGLTATTHWASTELLETTGAIYTDQRVVEHGKIMMGAGVSAGIDMALTLVSRIQGDDVAKAIQLGIEYDPQPPFDCGSPAKAGPDFVALLRAINEEEAAG